MPDIFLIAPPDAPPETLAARLESVLARVPARAMLVPRGEGQGDDYAARVAAVLPAAQARDVAVLVEGEPEDVRRLGADGLHIDGPLAAVRAAVAALKPDFIVGAVAGTRHDAMDKAEAGIDYVFFGPLSGATDQRTRELAQWWAETMEVPAVLSDPQAGPGGDALGCEFLAVGGDIWEAVP